MLGVWCRVAVARQEGIRLGVSSEGARPDRPDVGVKVTEEPKTVGICQGRLEAPRTEMEVLEGRKGRSPGLRTSVFLYPLRNT